MFKVGEASNIHRNSRDTDFERASYQVQSSIPELPVGSIIVSDCLSIRLKWANDVSHDLDFVGHATKNIVEHAWNRRQLGDRFAMFGNHHGLTTLLHPIYYRQTLRFK